MKPYLNVQGEVCLTIYAQPIFGVEGLIEKTSHQYNSPPPKKKRRNNSLAKAQQKANKVKRRRKK